MKEKGSEVSSSSLVIVSRRMLIACIAGISLFSFGLGYFFGYGSSSTNKMVKQVEADNKIATSEERTVLDASGKPTTVPPQVIPSAVPKEPPLKPGLAEGSKTLLKGSEEAEKQKKLSSTPMVEKNSESLLKKNTGESEKKTEKSTEKKPERKLNIGTDDRPHKERGPSVAKARKLEVTPPVKKLTAKRAKGNAQKIYALQVGAFQDPKKAERLKRDLGAKGYTVSITTVSSKPGKTFSRVRLGPYTTKKEAEEIQANLKGQGMEGVVFPGAKYQR
jgi:DedD protein